MSKRINASQPISDGKVCLSVEELNTLIFDLDYAFKGRIKWMMKIATGCDCSPNLVGLVIFNQRKDYKGIIVAAKALHAEVLQLQTN